MTTALTPLKARGRGDDLTPHPTTSHRGDTGEVVAAMGGASGVVVASKKQRRADPEAEADAGAEGDDVGAAAEAPATVMGDDMDVTMAEGGEGSEAAPMSKKKKTGRKRGKRPSKRTREARKAELGASAE